MQSTKVVKTSLIPPPQLVKTCAQNGLALSAICERLLDIATPEQVEAASLWYTETRKKEIGLMRSLQRKYLVEKTEKED